MLGLLTIVCVICTIVGIWQGFSQAEAEKLRSAPSREAGMRLGIQLGNLAHQKRVWLTLPVLMEQFISRMPDGEKYPDAWRNGLQDGYQSVAKDVANAFKSQGDAAGTAAGRSYAAEYPNPPTEAILRSLSQSAQPKSCYQDEPWNEAFRASFERAFRKENTPSFKV